MTKKRIELLLGSLLHDIGKVVYRTGKNKNHSDLGYEFVKENCNIQNQEILDQIRYHHEKNLSEASISRESSAYITYIADNIAAGIDRREIEGESGGFDRNMPLQSIFNILNGNDQSMSYKPGYQIGNGEIDYPTPEEKRFDSCFYTRILKNTEAVLNGISCTKEYIDSLLEGLEAYWSFIPSSTSRKERADISLYDHSKITAAIACCIEDYCEENRIQDLK